MVATKTDSSPDAKRVEAWSAPPEQYAICAPAPPKTTIVYSWPDPTDEDPERVLKVKVQLTGPLDRFDPALPDYAHAFDWDHESTKARAQIANYVRNGTGEMDDITARLGDDEITWIVGGRHRVLYARIANQIREHLGLKLCKVRSSRKKIPAARASTAIVLSNIRHRRDPIAEGREYAKAMYERNITAAELAEEIGESVAHVRRLVKIGENGHAATKAPAEKAPRVMHRRQMVRLAQSFEEDHDERGREMGELIRYVLNPASKPPTWLKAYLKEDR